MRFFDAPNRFEYRYSNRYSNRFGACFLAFEVGFLCSGMCQELLFSCSESLQNDCFPMVFPTSEVKSDQSPVWFDISQAHAWPIHFLVFPGWFSGL